MGITRAEQIPSLSSDDPGLCAGSIVLNCSGRVGSDSIAAIRVFKGGDTRAVLEQHEAQHKRWPAIATAKFQWSRSGAFAALLLPPSTMELDEPLAVILATVRRSRHDDFLGQAADF